VIESGLSATFPALQLDVLGAIAELVIHGTIAVEKVED